MGILIPYYFTPAFLQLLPMSQGCPWEGDACSGLFQAFSALVTQAVSLLIFRTLGAMWSYLRSHPSTKLDWKCLKWGYQWLVHQWAPTCLGVYPVFWFSTSYQTTPFAVLLSGIRNEQSVHSRLPQWLGETHTGSEWHSSMMDQKRNN